MTEKVLYAEDSDAISTLHIWRPTASPLALVALDNGQIRDYSGPSLVFILFTDYNRPSQCLAFGTCTV